MREGVITVYGVDSPKMQVLKQVLGDCLKRAQLEILITEVTEVEELIRRRIHKVPSFQWNDEPVQEMGVEKFSVAIRKVVQTILKKNNYGHMKKILVPYDFSAAASNAFSYAQNLADSLQAMIYVVHVFTPSFTEIDGAVIEDEAALEVKKKALKEFVDAANQDWIGEIVSAPLVEGEVIEGFPAEKIIELGREYDMILLGAQGENQLLKNIFGSVATEVAKNASVPVMIIPSGSQYRKIQRVVYAAADHEIDEVSMPKAMDLSKQLHAAMSVVHIAPPTADMNLKLNLPSSIADSADIAVEIIHAGDTAAALTEYAKTTRGDLLVLATKERSFWSSLFHTSMTKKLVQESDTPVLIYHL